MWKLRALLCLVVLLGLAGDSSAVDNEQFFGSADSFVVSGNGPCPIREFKNMITIAPRTRPGPYNLVCQFSANRSTQPLSIFRARRNARFGYQVNRLDISPEQALVVTLLDAGKGKTNSDAVDSFETTITVFEPESPLGFSLYMITVTGTGNKNATGTGLQCAATPADSE